MSKRWPYRTGGIPDDFFVRGDVPMTKSEVRALTLAKARLNEDSVVWDIGAGTGSISIEAALAAPHGQIYAIERNNKAHDLIQKNLDVFELENVVLCPGEAPQILAELSLPDRVIVGGSGGHLREIIENAVACLPSGGRIVVNAATLETLTEATHVLKGLHITDFEVTQVSISKSEAVARVHLLKASNPIFIISAEKR